MSNQKTSESNNQATGCNGGEQKSSTLRIGGASLKKLDGLASGASALKNAGKDVKKQDVIEYALSLIDESHAKRICDFSKPNEDYFRQRFDELCAEIGNLTWDDFLGMVMHGQVVFADYCNVRPLWGDKRRPKKSRTKKA